LENHGFTKDYEEWKIKLHTYKGRTPIKFNKLFEKRLMQVVNRQINRGY